VPPVTYSASNLPPSIKPSDTWPLVISHQECKQQDSVPISHLTGSDTLRLENTVTAGLNSTVVHCIEFGCIFTALDLGWRGPLTRKGEEHAAM